MNLQVDFMNFGAGMAQGAMAAEFMASGKLDVGTRRPWLDPKTGVPYVTVYVGGDPDKKESYRNMQVNTGTLRRDEWKSLDDAILRVGRSRLTGIQDLISKGLTYELGNAMGTTVLEWHDVSDSMEAQMDMDGLTRGTNDRPVFQFNYLPIPIIHVDYQINARALASSRSLGNPLDTTSAEHATRKVADYLESLLFTNTTFSFGAKDDRNRNSIYSYINHPDRNTVTLSTYGDWANESATSPTDIYESVRKMKETAIGKKKYGPYTLYIPTNFESRMDDDYSTSGASVLTVRERILKLEGINEIKVADTLPDSNVLLVQMEPETVRLVRGIGITNMESKAEFDFVSKYKVFTIQVPQIRSDQDGNCGVVHMS